MKQIGVLLLASLVGAACADTIEDEARQFINEVYRESNRLGTESMYARWAADTADQAHAEEAGKAVDVAGKKYDDYQRSVYKKIMSYPWKTFKDKNLKRMFFLASFLDIVALPDEKQKQLLNIQLDMLDINYTAQVREYNSADNKPTLRFMDVLDRIVKHQWSADELTFYWQEWHDTVGRQTRKLFTELVDLENEMAHLNGYSNVSRYWQAQLEIDDYENTMLKLYKQALPLFRELHAFVRHKLWVTYGRNNTIVDPTGPIPASLLGFGNGQVAWGGDARPLYDLLKPFPNKPSLDISPALKAKGITARRMAEMAEEFWVSLGLSKLPTTFWKNSIFEQKGDMDCSQVNINRYDFANGHDYRLIFCAQQTKDDFLQMYDYIGLTEYSLAYGSLPYFYKNPPGYPFDTGVEYLLEGFASSPNYLKTLGLLDTKIQFDNGIEINQLLNEALEHVFFLPFGYSLDKWRRWVIEGKISQKNYNCKYWEMRTSLQGIEPPVDRSEDDFDPGIDPKFLEGGQYIFYFFGEFLRYDLFRELCRTAGYYDPKQKPHNHLAFCDVSNSKQVGNKLKQMMVLGSSQAWPEVLEMVTGRRHVDGTGLLEYYRPLLLWLQAENRRNGATPGWRSKHNRCQGVNYPRYKLHKKRW